MERALSLANSILHQRARVARLTLHAPTIESAMEKIAHTPPALDNWGLSVTHYFCHPYDR
jgi:hypothetical protein